MIKKLEMRIILPQASMTPLVMIVLIFISALAINTRAFAEISVEPTRIALDAKTRTAVITIRNDDTKPYQVSPVWTHVVQANDGSLHPTEQKISLEQMPTVRVWPAVAIVQPGTSINYSVLLDPGARLGEETRTHLRFDLDPVRGNGPRWAVVVPVFVRGALINPEVEIIDTRMNAPNSFQIFMRNRAGASPHGQILLFDQTGRKLTELSNVNLYENGQITSFVLELPEHALPPVLVLYLGNAEFAGTVFAEKKLSITRDRHR